MGLFDRKETPKTKLEEYLIDNESILRNDEKTYIKGVINKIYPNPFFNDELLIIVLDVFKNYYEEVTIDEYIKEVKSYFDEIYFETSDFTHFKRFADLFKVDGIIKSGLFDIKFYRLFNNKECYYQIMNDILEKNITPEMFYKISEFLQEIRGTYTSEESFYYDALVFINKISVSQALNPLIEETRKRRDKTLGIYDIDEKTLDLIYEKALSAEGIISELERLTKTSTDISDELKNKLSTYKTEIEMIKQSATSDYKKDLDSRKDEIDKYITKRREELLNALITEKNKLSTELYSEKDSLIKVLQQYSEAITNLALAKSSEITRAGSEQITKLDAFVTNQPHLKELVESIAPSAETIKLITETAAKLENFKELNTIGMPGIVSTPNIIINDKEIDYTVNRYFDKSRSFTSRINEIKEKMDKNRKKGVLYHKKTLEIITAILEDVAPYLYGPSGGGKSYAVKLIADLLDIEYINTGYVNEEYQVTSAEPFLGNFKPSVFQECYKYGKIAFVDEMDNGNARANVILNPFLRHSEDYYTFSNNEKVRRHPNFRIIAAGNTDGKGSTKNHNTREKIEGSVMQRLVPFYIGYDEEVEKDILSSYPYWYKFILAFREAQKRWDGNEGLLTFIDAITTADADKIKRYLDDKAFTEEQILALDFVQTKSREYLTAIKDYLDEYYNYNGNKDEKRLYKKFNQEVEKYYQSRGL